MNTETEIAPQVNQEIISLMKTSGSILEGAEIRKESGKTIIKPKKKITLKEFLASQPYKLTLDNSVPQSKSAPCNWRQYTYYSLTKFEPYTGKATGVFINSSSDVTWSAMKYTYGFRGVMVYPTDYNYARNAGWENSEIYIRLWRSRHDSLQSIQAISSSSPYVQGFYIDEPIEHDECNPNAQVNYVNRMASLVYPKPLLIGSYKIGTEIIYCGLLPSTIDLTYYYNNILSTSSNSYVLCDEYRNDHFSMNTRWMSYKVNYGLKNTKNFLHIDFNRPNNTWGYANWNDLFGFAASIGISKMWLFSDREYNNQNGMYSFCQSAFNNYWLRGFNENITVIERCISPNCEHRQDREDPDGEQYWFIDQIIYHNNWWEVFP